MGFYPIISTELEYDKIYSGSESTPDIRGISPQDSKFGRSIDDWASIRPQVDSGIEICSRCNSFVDRVRKVFRGFRSNHFLVPSSHEASMLTQDLLSGYLWPNLPYLVSYRINKTATLKDPSRTYTYFGDFYHNILSKSVSSASMDYQNVTTCAEDVALLYRIAKPSPSSYDSSPGHIWLPAFFSIFAHQPSLPELEMPQCTW
jgi:hypothetical protein